MGASFTSYIHPGRLTGPMFAKELVVSSRRRRNYVLRSLYLLVLTVFVAGAWRTTTVIASAVGSVQVSRMAEIGKTVTSTIIWFQFVTAQLIAVVMLSTSISDEIHSRTLGVLMTTPISSFQIVLGKLSSRLLQVLLLIGISFPLLSMIRVFGGVPWDYVVAGICMTLTAVIFAGSVSLLLSILDRGAAEVVIETAAICAVWWVMPGILLRYVWPQLMQSAVHRIAVHADPFTVLITNTNELFSPSATGPGLSWLLNCAIMLAGSVFWLGLSTLLVRRAALRQIAGRTKWFEWGESRTNIQADARADESAAVASIRPVKGPPVVWKEMRVPVTKGRRLKVVISLAVALGIAATAYGFCIARACLHEKEIQIAFILAFLFLGLLRVVTLASSSITSEKESRMWPVLLTTTLTDSQIVFGKIIGSILRAWPFWAMIAGHIVVFTLIGFLHPVTILPMAILIAVSAWLTSTVSVFLSSCFKRTSVATTVAIVLFMVLTMPVCCLVPTSMFGPFGIGGAILIACAGAESAAVPLSELDYGLFDSGIAGFLVGMAMLVCLMAIYMAVSLAPFMIAQDNIRSNKVF